MFLWLITIFHLVISGNPYIKNTKIPKWWETIDSPTYQQTKNLFPFPQKFANKNCPLNEMQHFSESKENHFSVNRCPIPAPTFLQNDVSFDQQQKISAINGWKQLQISDRVISSLGYEGFIIDIYNHASNDLPTTANKDKKYFFVPAGLLYHMSSVAMFDSFTRKAVMKFQVIMWNDIIRNRVYQQIYRLFNNETSIHQVRILPFDQVMIFSNKKKFNIELSAAWFNYRGDRSLQFKYFCDKMIDCEELAESMRNDPSRFDLSIRLSISTQKTQITDTTIKISSIMKGEMISKLTQKYEKGDVLLTADDKKKLLRESTTNIIIQSIQDSDNPSVASQEFIFKMLENLLNFTQVTIQKGDNMTWGSVFWNEDNYRPDKTSKTINDIYSKLDNEAKKKLVTLFTNTDQFDAGGSIGYDKLLKVDAQFKTDLSRSGSMSMNDVDKLLTECINSIGWDGVKFLPKQMKLFRINLARLSDNQIFRDFKVKIAYTTSMLIRPLASNINGFSFHYFNDLYDSPQYEIFLFLKGKYYTFNNS